MGKIGTRAFAAARGMLGAPFRPQGCDPDTGLDCVGLVWAAYRAAGRELARPRGYPLRGWTRGRIEAALVTAEFAPADRAETGDVALIAFAAGQFHLGLIGPASLIHAHAGLRRVVETPLHGSLSDAEWWRLSPPRCD